MEALSQLDRVKQVEAIHSYNNMKENLMEYLTKFADNKKVVREDDIKTFFEVIKCLNLLNSINNFNTGYEGEQEVQALPPVNSEKAFSVNIVRVPSTIRLRAGRSKKSWDNMQVMLFCHD